MATRGGWVAAVAVLVSLSMASASLGTEQVVHRQTFLSPVVELGSGDVVDRYDLMEFPTGHIAMRNFFAEMVDEHGVPVPLSDVYLHHWVVLKYNVKKGYKELRTSVPQPLPESDGLMEGHSGMRHKERMAFQEGAEAIQVKNYGTCNDGQNAQYFGLGSETRHTNTEIPAPYGLVTGDLMSVPEGFEDGWYLNIHAINTQEAVDVNSCDECLCAAYGVTNDRQGRPLSEGYVGGLHCCYDKTRCAVKEGASDAKRKFFLRYTVTWVDWDSTVVPVITYALDVTDPRTSLSEKPQCKVEYTVDQCSKGSSNSECVDHRHALAALPKGGDIIFAGLHQHFGGLGGVLYGKDGVVLCESLPKYGKGTDAGDEVGFVVGMTTCFPEPGSMYVESMEELHFDSYYSSERLHTGVMGIFLLYVAEPVGRIEEVVA